MSEIFISLKQINQSKHKCDSLLSDMQRATDKVIKKDLTEKQINTQHSNIAHLLNQIKVAHQKHTGQLSEIRVNINRAKHQGNTNMTNEQQLYENLQEYFSKLLDTAKRLHSSSSEKVQQVQKLSLIGSGSLQISDVNHLENGYRAASEATELARQVQGTLKYQSSRLDTIRSKVGSFVGQLNISRTLTRMISSRSKQDYRLILFLTVLLVVEVLVCYFYIRPWIRGQ